MKKQIRASHALQLISLATCSLLISCNADAAVRVKIRPDGVSQECTVALQKWVFDRPELRQKLAGARYRILSTVFQSQLPEKESYFENASENYDRTQCFEQAFQIDVYDYTSDRLLEISGNFLKTHELKIRQSSDQPAATPDEFAEAVEIVRSHPDFSGTQAHWKPYEAMPPILKQGRNRVVPVGLFPKDPSFDHEIVGVNLSTLKVIRYPTGAPPTALAEITACAPPSANQSNTARGTAGQATITVQDGATELWKFRVTRPSVSSGRWGSAIDLRDIFYKGKRVLSQLHTPILNVLYDQNLCGPYRDWQYSENPFQAVGTLMAPGILQASEKPSTLLDSLVDRGNFRGIAVYTELDETVLVTELAAGWYRYKAEFRFHKDGTLKPRWGFAAIQDSCTCNRHHHHGYWRMDFDIGSGANTAEYFDGTQWNPVSTEARFHRDATHQKWRISEAASGTKYEIEAGLTDGTADVYGKGDTWILKYMNGQIDDSRFYRNTSINIDAFDTNQNVFNTDLIFWYGVHFTHTSDDTRHSFETVGPTIRPVTPTP